MLSNKQQEYLNNCNHRWNIKTGATGSGKSYIDYTYVIPKRLMCLKGEGAAVILGNTQGTVLRNIIEPMRLIYGSVLVGETIKPDNSMNIFGQKVYVMGADNKKHIAKIQGMTIEYAYGDEMTTWTEGVFQMLKSRLRCIHSIFDGTCNPESPLHFIKNFIDSDADVYCQNTTIFDNPFLPKHFVEALCMEYAGTVYYDRFILGKWALAQGLIYSMYQEALVDEVPNVPVSEYAVSIDYGTMNAFAAILWCKRDNVWYGERNYYYSGRDTGIQKTDQEYSDDLDKWIADIVQESIKHAVYNPFVGGAVFDKTKTIIDPSAASFIALLKKNDWSKVISADNAVADGIRETAVALKTGKIKILKPVMKEWIKEASGYVWDDKSVEEKPVKINDHLMDATRYFVKTMRVAAKNRPVPHN